MRLDNELERQVRYPNNSPHSYYTSNICIVSNFEKNINQPFQKAAKNYLLKRIFLKFSRKYPFDTIAVLVISFKHVFNRNEGINNFLFSKIGL